MRANPALALVPAAPPPDRCVGCGTAPVRGLTWCRLCWAQHAPVRRTTGPWRAADVFAALKAEAARPPGERLP